MLDDDDIMYIAYRGTANLVIEVCHSHSSRLYGKLVLSWADRFTEIDDHVVGWRPNSDAGFAALLELSRTFLLDHPEWTEIEQQPNNERLRDAKVWLAGCGINELNTPRKVYRSELRRFR